MYVLYSDSKTDLKLGHDSPIKLHLFEDARNVVTRLTAVCCMLLPHNPYRLPQHYKRHVCGSYCSYKHRFVWICVIFEHRFCLNYMGAVRHWQPFWPSTKSSPYRPVLIFQLTVHPRATDKPLKIWTSSTVRAKQIESYYVTAYEIPGIRGCP